MDGFDINAMASMKRVAIVCSTWGEGEMPDNAEAPGRQLLLVARRGWTACHSQFLPLATLPTNYSASLVKTGIKDWKNSVQVGWWNESIVM